MASVFRQKYTVWNPRTGTRETRESKKWYFSFVNEHGIEERRPGFKDRGATEHLAHEMEVRAERIRSGLLPPAARHAGKPLRELLTEYLAHLRAKDDGDKHVALVETRITAALDALGWALPAQVCAEALTGWLARRRKAAGKKGRFGAATSNHYLAAWKGFTRWMVGRGALAADPLARASKLRAEADRRLTRRTLRAEEFARLLAAAREAPPRRRECVPGADREVLYLVASATGLRAAELASLTPSSFALDSAPPTVTVEAAYSKRRRRDTVPLPAWLAPRLRAFLSGRPPGERVWPGAWWKKAAVMLRRDLEAAEVPFKDAQGRVFDFHSLRPQYITDLARSGVGLSQAQKLARHSTPTLTSNYYTHLDLSELAASADKLPPPQGQGPKAGPKGRKKKG